MDAAMLLCWHCHAILLYCIACQCLRGHRGCRPAGVAAHALRQRQHAPSLQAGSASASVPQGTEELRGELKPAPSATMMHAAFTPCTTMLTLAGRNAGPALCDPSLPFPSLAAAAWCGEYERATAVAVEEDWAVMESPAL